MNAAVHCTKHQCGRTSHTLWLLTPRTSLPSFNWDLGFLGFGRVVLLQGRTVHIHSVWLHVNWLWDTKTKAHCIQKFSGVSINFFTPFALFLLRNKLPWASKSEKIRNKVSIRFKGLMFWQTIMPQLFYCVLKGPNLVLD